MHAEVPTTRDVLGHINITKDKREALLNQFERSGSMGKPYAKRVGLNYQTLAC